MHFHKKYFSQINDLAAMHDLPVPIFPVRLWYRNRNSTECSLRTRQKGTTYMFKYISPTKLRLSVLVLACVVAGHAHSQTTSVNISKQPTATNTATTINSTTTKIKPETAETKPFSLATSLGYSQKIAVEENAPRERGTDLEILAGYKITDQYSVSGKIALSYDMNGPKNTTASDTTLAFKIKGLQINDELSFAHSLSAIVPTSEESINKNKLKFAIGQSNSLTYKTDFLTAKYGLSFSKNIHEYTQNADRKILNEYGLTNSIDFVVPVTDQFSVSTGGLYRMILTYENDQKFNFGFDADLNYDFTEKLSANIGTTNEGSALKSNGTDSKINIYDENSSIYRAGVSYVY